MGAGGAATVVVKCQVEDHELHPPDPPELTLQKYVVPADSDPAIIEVPANESSKTRLANDEVVETSTRYSCAPFAGAHTRVGVNACPVAPSGGAWSNGGEGTWPTVAKLQTSDQALWTVNATERTRQ